mmetsp:Transcript_26251/g.31737  ORF Transcript_26251/g.31737 Transcript_26251/m.31737 type:complete len:211 (+) Transcript_26251:148-780(+)
MKERHRLALLLHLVNIFSYADRTNMGIVLLEFSDALTQEQTGRILAAFFWGYLLTQIPAGYYWTPRVGGKTVLACGVFVWTVADLSTIWTAKVFWKMPVFWYLSRIGLGLGEGVSFPCQHALAAQWYPRDEKARLVSVVAAGADVGLLSSIVAAPFLISYFGRWEWVFGLFGFLNIIWLFAWRRWGADGPECSTTIDDAERAYILSERQG